ncbi:hypothetical protein [Muriicola soli]|uniref:Uncharacterized protein n=1 Tax=Muriicola soli TaxID=2507538 RepID=A0A411EAI1_9FLAO|nr:hypothetical protein [Muriicola soli]QBA64543.1 hypothetical protein EQY75_08400 [Muriicola soli]
MKIQSKKGVVNHDLSEAPKISRRGLWPFLAASLVFPMFARSNSKRSVRSEDHNVDAKEYETLLKPDGTVVKVRRSTLSSSRIVKKNVTNKSLLSWLSRK